MTEEVLWEGGQDVYVVILMWHMVCVGDDDDECEGLVGLWMVRLKGCKCHRGFVLN